MDSQGEKPAHRQVRHAGRHSAPNTLVCVPKVLVVRADRGRLHQIMAAGNAGRVSLVERAAADALAQDHNGVSAKGSGDE